MLGILKKLASRLPARWQLGLQRTWYTLKLRSGRFTHDEPEYARLAEWVKPGDFVIDIGANVGLYTARLTTLVGSSGHVFAFEPMPRTFHLLSHNARLFAHPNLTLWNAAASDRCGMAGMVMPTADTRMPDIYQAHISTQANGQTVYCVAIDTLAIPKRVSFVKIDVEGHELSALRGMEHLLRRDHPTIVIEGRDPAVRQFLIGVGYREERVGKSPNTIFRMA